MTSRTSKRSVLSFNTSDNIEPLPKKSKRRSKKPIEDHLKIPQNIFTRLLSEAGINFDFKGNKIETDPVTFYKRLNNIVKSRNDDITETKDCLIAALDESIEDEKFFVSCLMPTELSESLQELGLTSSQMSSSIQDSVLKLMMRCTHLQSIAINAILKKLPLYIENETVNVDPCFGISESCGADIVNMPRLILNQLRWLDVFEDSNEIASQLLEISSVMRSEIASDIIAFVPDLLPDDCDHEKIALKLCDLLSEGPENITSAVFDALSNFNLSDDVQKKIYDLALSYLTTASVQDIAVIIKYLLRSCNSADAAKQVIETLHPHLDFSVLISGSSEVDLELTKTSTALIADIMYSSMQFQTFVGAAWLNVLEKTSSVRINVGDVIALLLLCDVSSVTQRRNATSLLQSKLKRGLLPHKILRKTVHVCSHILSSRFSSIRQLTQSLLWHSDPSLKQAAAALYEEYLLALDSFCKQECIGMLAEHISSLTKGKSSETSVALDVLCTVSRTNVNVLTPYANFLRDALDHMDVMTLEQVRKSYQILSLLAFSATDSLTSGMKDELHMILQKQLTHVSDRFKHVGIIGSIAMLIAMSKPNSNPDGSKKIEQLFELLHFVLRSDIKGWSLLFDEVFIAMQGRNELSEFLLKKLNDEAQSKLQEKFLTDYDGTQPTSSSSRSADIACCYRFGLLSEDEQKETDLGIALTPLLLSSNNRYVTTLLCSLFRAISSIERKLTGTLGEIDALLCCPVLLHDVIYDDKSKFVDLAVETQMLLLDSLFAVLNWFRELVSVFCSESDPEVLQNVLVRFKQMCDLQTTIDRMLTVAPESYLPVVVNSSVADVSAIRISSAGKLTQKTAKSGATVSTSTQINDKSQSTSQLLLKSPKKTLKAKRQKKASSSHAEKVTLVSGVYRPFLRELNKEVLLLLKYRLQCEVRGFRESQNEMDTDEKFLRPRHLQVLLYDLNDKVKHRLGVAKLPFGFGNQSASGVGFEQIDQNPAFDVARFAISVLPHLCTHLESIENYFKNKDAKDQTADDLDESSFSIGAEVHQHERLLACYELLVEILNHVVSWHGLDDEENEKLLLSLMKILSSRSRKSETSTLVTMLSNSFRYVRALSPTLPSSHAAHTLLKLLITLHDFADDHKSQQTWMAKQISDTALEFLRKEWSDLECIGNNQKRNVIISGLFSTHLKYSNDVLESTEQFLKNSLSYLLEDPLDREDDAVNYPCLTKANYYLFYKTMIEILGNEASAIPSPAKTLSSDVDNVDLLLKWSEVVKVLDLLIRVLKTFPSRLMLNPALKYAKATVESFVRCGIPVCEATFREHQDDVIALLKKVQSSTRQLQHAACHSKIAKDASLTNHVPALKRCLENFVFRVKAMLVLHNCQDAFWLGNLKNRNLQGEELLSQMSTSSSPEPDLNGDPDTSEPSYSESY